MTVSPGLESMVIVPPWRSTRVIAEETIGSSSTVRIVGLLMSRA